MNQQVLSNDDVYEVKNLVSFPYEVPDQWKLVRLADQELFAFENGIWTGKKEPFIYCPVIRNTNFSNDGSLNLSDVAVIPIEQRQLERKRLISGDIIIERSGGGPQQPVGRVVFFDLTEGNYCFSNFTTRLRVIDSAAVDPRYLHLYLLYFHNSGQTEKLQNRTTGIRNLAFEDYKNSVIPLPSLPQQSSIVQVIRAVREAIKTRRDELDLERERKSALMEYLFTYGIHEESTKQTAFGDIPQSWHMKRLEDVIAIGPKNGIYKPHSSYGQGVPIVRINDFGNEGDVLTAVANRVSLSSDEVIAYGLSRNDILINRVNSLSHIGKVAFVEDLTEPTVYESNMMAFSINSSMALPKYVFYYLNLPFVRQQLKGKAKRAVAQSSINQSDVKSIDLLLPSLQEQDEIVSIVDICYLKIACLENELVLLEELFKAILEELMTGRLSTLPLIEEGEPHD